MSRHLLAAAAASLLFLPSVQAQDFYVPDNANSGGCNVIPFGVGTTSSTWSNQIYQTMATAADLGNNAVLNICDISFISCGTGLNISHYDEIEIKLGQTTATTLSSTFASNLVTNVQTVLSCKNFDWHNYGGQFSRIGLQKDYLYIAAQGSTLVLQICVKGGRKLLGGTTGHRTGARPRLYNFGWASTATCPTTGTVGGTAALKWGVHARTAGLSEFGIWCKGSGGNPALKLGGSAQLGQNMTVDLSNGPATRPVWLAIDLSYINGGFDLGIIGAGGCNQYVRGVLVLATVTNSSGGSQTAFTVPNNPSLVCTRLFTQYYCADNGANNAGLTTSNYGLIMPGN